METDMTREEAIEALKEKLDYYARDKRLKAACETLIPELRESDSGDERTRKALLKLVSNNKTAGYTGFYKENGITCDDAIAYLEKQKESLHVSKTCKENANSFTDEDEKMANAIKLILSEVPMERFDDEGVDYAKCLAYIEQQKEQKPENKEITLTNFEEVLNTFLFDFANSPIEDCEPKEYTKKHSAEILKAAYTELNAQLKQDIFEATQEGRREGYEVAKAEQKPAEWSEEDEKRIKQLIYDTEFIKAHYEKRKEELGEQFNNL